MWFKWPSYRKQCSLGIDYFTYYSFSPANKLHLQIAIPESVYPPSIQGFIDLLIKISGIEFLNPLKIQLTWRKTRWPSGKGDGLLIHWALHTWVWIPSLSTFLFWLAINEIFCLVLFAITVFFFFFLIILLRKKIYFNFLKINIFCGKNKKFWHFFKKNKKKKNFFIKIKKG